MFDIDEAVSKWRDSLYDADALTALDVKELEGHLREEAARVEALGLSAEEAFVIASRRMGPPSALNIEFEKADPARVWKTRAFWIVLGVFGHCVWNSAMAAVISTLGQVLLSGVLPDNIASAVFLVVWGSIMGVVIYGLVLMSRGKLSYIIAAIQRRYRRQYNMLIDVSLLVVAIPILHFAPQALLSSHLHSSVNFNDTSAQILYFTMLSTIVIGPLAIGVLLYSLFVSRRESTNLNANSSS